MGGDVAVGETCPAVLAGDVAAGVASPAVAGVASLADLAGDVAVGVASPAVARVASLANLAGVVTVGVISPTVAGAASLADFAGDDAVGKASPGVAGVASLADLAGVVTIGVAPSAVAGVASPGRCWGGSPDQPYWGCHRRSGIPGRCWGGIPGRCWGGVPGRCWGGVPGRVSEEDCCSCEPPNVWCLEMPEVQSDSGCEYVDYVGCSPDCVDCMVLEGVDGCPVGTVPSEPLCVITEDMTYQEKIEALSGTIYDSDDVSDNRPGQ